MGLAEEAVPALPVGVEYSPADTSVVHNPAVVDTVAGDKSDFHAGRNLADSHSR